MNYASQKQLSYIKSLCKTLTGEWPSQSSRMQDIVYSVTHRGVSVDLNLYSREASEIISILKCAIERASKAA